MRPKFTEQRRFPRFEVDERLTVHILSGLPHTESDWSVEGMVQDISQGGLGILIMEPLLVSNPIQCQIRLASLPVSIPTLAQVCWCESGASGEFRAGIQFLL